MTEKKSKSKMVFSTTNKIISIISNSLDISNTKGILSKLRNSTGKPFEEIPSSLQIVYENIPEELLNPNYNISNAERAIITALQLFAIHQQSKSYSVNEIKEDRAWDNFGYSLSFLRDGGKNIALDNRFNAMIRSTSFEELTNHLRQLVKISKSSDKNIRINYPKLAIDLYKFLNNGQENIRLNWARAYYFYKEKGDKENDK
ncbi:MAG: type I-E CRISPR-associated protein Cse2/CasB [Tissierellia bacterium]|nr:type I-E CRISPR-associated protein Cse2/CasB [Tissierellia bacterium]